MRETELPFQLREIPHFILLLKYIDLEISLKSLAMKQKRKEGWQAGRHRHEDYFSCSPSELHDVFMYEPPEVL